MEKLFKLKQNGTTVRTEVLAGLTTFMTMAYIIALNPNLIVGFGANAEVGGALWNGIFLGHRHFRRHRHAADGVPRQQALCHGARHGLEQLLGDRRCGHCGCNDRCGPRGLYLPGCLRRWASPSS